MKCVHAFHRKRPTLRLCSIVPDNRVEPKILISLLKTPKKKPTLCVGFDLYGGEGGIRTPGRFNPSPDFKSGAFDRTLPPLLIN